MSEQQIIQIVVSSLTLLCAVGFLLLLTLPRFRRFAHCPSGAPMSIVTRVAFCGFWFYGAFVCITAEIIPGWVALWMIPIGLIVSFSHMIDTRRYRRQQKG